MILRHLKEVAQGKARLLQKRSSQWSSFRKEWLRGKHCAACGGVEYLEAHHVVPFHIDPTRELDPANLIALCDRPGRHNCHLDVGHLGNWRRENPNVVADAQRELKKVAQLRPRK